MKFLDETGLKFIATKFKELRDSLGNKVDKVENKQLSTNDYTNEAKAKVDAIPTDPKYTDTVQDLSGYAKKTDIPTLEEKEKLKQLPYIGQLHDMLNKKLDKTDKVDMSKEPDLSDDKSYTTPRFVFYVLTTIFSDAMKSLKEKIQEELNKKVDKVEGKVLSDFNFSGAEKIKLQNLPSADEFAVEWEKKANKTELKTKLSEMTDDSTHRLVTDAEKTAWNNKLDSVSGKDISRSKTKGYNTSNTWSSLSTNRDLEDWIGDFDKRTRENKTELAKKVDSVSGKGLSSNDFTNAFLNKLNSTKQQVILTQSDYDALSSTDKNDSSKIYFIKG